MEDEGHRKRAVTMVYQTTNLNPEDISQRHEVQCIFSIPRNDAEASGCQTGPLLPPSYRSCDSTVGCSIWSAVGLRLLWAAICMGCHGKGVRTFRATSVVLRDILGAPKLIS